MHFLFYLNEYNFKSTCYNTVYKQWQDDWYADAIGRKRHNKKNWARYQAPMIDVYEMHTIRGGVPIRFTL